MLITRPLIVPRIQSGGLKLLAHKYKIWPESWSADLDPDHPNEKRYVGITARAKRDRESPYEVFNELVAMRLGHLIGLPIPAGIVVERNGNFFFASCDVSTVDGELPAADVPRLCRDRSDDACGIMVFDAWIANTDRHDENIWYDYYGDVVVAFDHGRGLLGTSGRPHMNSNKVRLGIRLDEVCLADHIISFNEFPKWHDRICRLHPNAIIQTVTEASSVDIDKSLALECGDWLINRRNILPDLFRNERHVFKKLQKTIFDPFGVIDDYFPEYCI